MSRHLSSPDSRDVRRHAIAVEVWTSIGAVRVARFADFKLGRKIAESLLEVSSWKNMP